VAKSQGTQALGIGAWQPDPLCEQRPSWLSWFRPWRNHERDEAGYVLNVISARTQPPSFFCTQYGGKSVRAGRYRLCWSARAPLQERAVDQSTIRIHRPAVAVDGLDASWDSKQDGGGAIYWTVCPLQREVTLGTFALIHTTIFHAPT
jgi:hypothetical protein